MNSVFEFSICLREEEEEEKRQETRDKRGRRVKRGREKRRGEGKKENDYEVYEFSIFQFSFCIQYFEGVEMIIFGSQCCLSPI